jgi:type I restriction enzyme R subunit
MGKAPKPAKRTLQIVERAHPELGRLGVVWQHPGQRQVLFDGLLAEKVRRTLEGNFTFVLMTDRDDLDSQIYKTFVGCGVADEETPRRLRQGAEVLLKQNHRYVFSLIHKFNRDLSAGEAYSERDDIIVISDEAHRTQARSPATCGSRCPTPPSSASQARRCSRATS